MNKLGVLQKKFIGKIYGPRRNKETDQYEIRSNTKIKELLGGYDITGILKKRKLSWLCRV